MKTSTKLESTFGLKLKNRAMLLRKPSFDLDYSRFQSPFPDPAPVVAHWRDRVETQTLLARAREILDGRYEVIGKRFHLGGSIQWRMDFIRGITTQPETFSEIPYLDPKAAGDYRVIWELNRQQHLVLLAQAWLFEQDEAYLRTIEEQIQSWTEQNPFLRSINWISGFEVALRAISWVWILHFAGDYLQERARQTLIEVLALHAAYLETNFEAQDPSRFDRLAKAVALHLIGSAFPGTAPGLNWRGFGTEEVEKQIAYQIQTDGSIRERSSYFHLYAVDLLLLHHRVEPLNAQHLEFLRRLARFLKLLFEHTRRLPLIGDDDGGRLFYPYGSREKFAEATLLSCSRVLPSFPWDAAPGAGIEQGDWLLGITSENPPANDDTAKRFHHFADAGLLIYRNGEVELIFQADAQGRSCPAHGHADGLQVLLRTPEEDLIVDPGTYTFLADEGLRNFYRTDTVHNTVTLEGSPQCQPVGVFDWRKASDVQLLQVNSSDTRFTARAECIYPRGAETAVRIARSLIACAKGDNVIVLVHDKLSGDFDPADEGIAWRQNWVLGSTVNVSAQGYRLSQSCQLLFAGEEQTEMEYFSRSTCLGSRVPARLLRVYPAGASSKSLATCFVIGKAQQCEVKRVEEEPQPVFEIRLDGEAVRLEPGDLSRDIVWAKV
jgi:hypothetical protein